MNAFRRSLLGQFLLRGLLPSVIVLVAVILFNARRGLETLESVARRNVQTQAKALASEMDGWNQATVGLVSTMRLVGQGELFGDRRASLAFLQGILKSHPEVEGAYFAYGPDADGGDARGLEAARAGWLPAACMNAQGRFIPYVFHDTAANRSVALEPLADPPTSDQLSSGAFMEQGAVAATLTEPDDRDGVLMTECTMPLVREGRLVGIVGVDRSLASLQRRLRAITARSGLNAMLLSAQGRFIAAAVGDAEARAGMGPAYESLSARALQDTPWAQCVGQLMASGGQDTQTAWSPVYGEDTLQSIAVVPTGGWRVVVEVPPSRLAMQVRRTVLVNMMVGALGALAVLAMLVRMAVRLAGRIRAAVAAARDVADGDLTRVYAVDGGDEAGLLLSSMNDMSGRLNELVGRVRGVTLEITGTATQMASASRQQEEVAQGFGASSAEIAAAVRQISVTGGELLRSMESLSVAAVESAQLAGEGREGLQAMGQTMQELASATAGVAERLAAINEKAVNINAIVDTITKVADQTNLLSVNAAIEAEKAGESGRGFLVVAREIRRLADQTAAATLDIETTVRQMQGAVSGGVMEMDRFSDQVRRGVEHVAGVGERLTKVIDRVGSVEGRFGQVTEGMQSQVQGAEQIRQSMDTLAQAAGRAREATSEFAQAASTLQSSLVQLRAAVGLFRLRDQA
ncbi:MAG: methyl-accepting chemotaxis protein [Phycisphaerales bacterium]